MSVDFGFKLAGSHARQLLEGAQESALRGESRRRPYFGNLDVRARTQQSLGIVYTVFVDKLCERAAALTVDAV